MAKKCKKCNSMVVINGFQIQIIFKSKTIVIYKKFQEVFAFKIFLEKASFPGLALSKTFLRK